MSWPFTSRLWWRDFWHIEPKTCCVLRGDCYCLHLFQIYLIFTYRIYPRIGRTFFKEKNVRNFGCGLYAGTRVLSSLICKISRHTQSQQSYRMLDSLIECIVWGEVNPCLGRILLLSAAMIVSSFWICLSLDAVQISLHVKPWSPFDAVHVKPHLFICRTTRKIHSPRHKKKKS